MKKPDLSAVKTFFIEKGEKVGVILCTGIMVVIVGWSLYSGFTSGGTASGKPLPEEIAGIAKNLEQRMLAPATEGKPKLPEMGPPWPPQRDNFAWAALFNLPDKAFTKKLNPRILSILPPEEGENHFQIDVIRDTYLHYVIEPKRKKVEVVIGGAGGAGAGGMMVAPPPMMQGMPGGAAAGLGANNLSMDARPVRMVVVSAIFPMREQLEEYRKALRFATINELLARRDLLPKPVGLEVMRAEILPGGKAMPWTPVFKYDPKAGKINVAPAIKQMLRNMVIDNQNPQSLAQYIFPGLVTPLPKLGHSEYPKLELKGIEPLEMVAGGEGGDPLNPMAQFMPKLPGPPKLPGKFPGVGRQPNPMIEGGEEAANGGAAALGEVQFRDEAWSKISKDLQTRFEEKYFAFDPLGTPLPEPMKKGAAGARLPGAPMPAMPMMPGMPGMEGMGGAGANFSNPWDRILGGAGAGGGMGMFGPMGQVGPMPGGEAGGEPIEPVEGAAPLNPNAAIELKDALVRFFDPDVEPGKTYRYSIRVRMANPNEGKKTDVAFSALADLKELDWVSGPPNGWPAQGWMLSPEVTIPDDYFWYATEQEPVVKIRNGADFSNNPPRETTAIQVHRWLKQGNEGGPIGAWVIAERFWVRRGDFVGRTNVMVEAPFWNKHKQAFEIANLPQVARGRKPPKNAINSGLPVNLTTDPPALIVDYDGGPRSSIRIGKDLVSNDASAVDILVLTPEGDLVVRNSRRDTDPEALEGGERNQRYEQWRDRLAELRAGNGRPLMGPGMMMPGGPPGGMP